MQEMSEFFLWNFIIFQLSVEFFSQNQSATGNVIQLIKKKSLIDFSMKSSIPVNPVNLPILKSTQVWPKLPGKFSISAGS